MSALRFRVQGLGLWSLYGGGYGDIQASGPGSRVLDLMVVLKVFA